MKHMTKEEMGEIIGRAIDRWLMTDPGSRMQRPPKPRYVRKAPDERKPRNGGHNRLPKMSEEQKKIYRKLKSAGLRRADALEAAGVGV